jgi:ubiquinol-cytochrome c reductase cytochrome b subunit
MAKHLAWLTQALFVISMLSGIVVIFAYYPSDAYGSVQKLNYLIPFGSFFRQLHYFSSEAFIIVLLMHVGMELSKKEFKLPAISWNYSILALFAVFILMFTGFVLKADQSANAAAQVAFSLLKETPLLAHLLPLFQDTQLFYWKFFIWHILFLPLILTYAIYRHTKRIGVDIRYFAIGLGLAILLILILSMPPDIALEAEVDHLKGPWFFWGAENLLQRSLSALSVNAILLWPFILLVLFFYHAKRRPIYLYLLLLWILSYAFFSF